MGTVRKLETAVKRVMGADRKSGTTPTGSTETSQSVAAELSAVRAQRDHARAELAQLEEERLASESFDASEALARRIAEQRWEAERMEAQLPQLEERLQAAKARELAAALERHRARRLAVYRKLRAAIIAAGEIQAEAIRADVEACAEIGEHVARKYLPPVVFRGLLLPDLIELWAHEQDRLIEGLRMAPPPAAPSAVARQTTAQASKQPHSVFIDSVTGRELSPEPGPKHAPKAPDDISPLREGHVRAVVVRAGYAGPDGALSHTGRRIQLPRALAHQAARSGAIEILEEKTP